MPLASIPNDPVPDEHELNRYKDIYGNEALKAWRNDRLKIDPSAFALPLKDDVQKWPWDCKTYDEYLNHKSYKILKRRFLKGKHCAGCIDHSTGELQVHHRDYRLKVLYGYDLSMQHWALVPLCEPCHKKVHAGERQTGPDPVRREKVLADLVAAKDAHKALVLVCSEAVLLA